MTTRDPFARSAYAPHVGMYASQSVPAARGSVFSRIVYLFAWSLIGAGAVAGCLFSLYRNDVLLNAARQRGWEAPYLLLERKLVGTPGWGTPRSLSAVPVGALLTQSTSALLPSVVSPSVSPAAAPAQTTESAAAPIAVKAQPSEPPQTSTSEGLKITSLDSLPVGRAAAPTVVQAPAARAVAPVPAPHAVAPAPAPHAVRAAVASTPKATVPARPVRESEPARPASKPVKAVAAAPEKPEKPAKAAPKAPPPPADDNPLKAAIRSAIIKDQSGK